MFVRVLGPIDASEHEHPIRLSRRERALLAVLALHAGRTVPWDTLADGVFGSEVPQRVRHALATSVSRLRGRLGEERILTDVGGYRLNTDAVVLDVDVFERAVNTRQGLDDALRLWRGPPYADLEDWTPAVAARARLEELFWTAEEDRARQGLEAGTSGPLIAELTSMTVAQPYREERWVLLIQALAAAGRQADALAAYRRARTLLVEELGIEPGPALVAAERAVLLGGPAGVPAPPIDEAASSSGRGAHLPVATVRLIGRDHDVAAVAALVHGERLVTLTGSGGVGKTELALAVASTVEGGFSDGAWWVDLATLDPGRDVGPMVSAVLGVRERRDADVVDVIAEALGTRHVLLVDRQLRARARLDRGAGRWTAATLPECQSAGDEPPSPRAARRAHCRSPSPPSRRRRCPGVRTAHRTDRQLLR